MNTQTDSDNSEKKQRVFVLPTWAENRHVADILRLETVGGALLLVGAALGLIWANTPWADDYFALRDLKVGPSAPLHLDLSIGKWAADGLLAVFFFVAGLELKREFVAGDLRDPRQAAVPVAAAVCGVIIPAIVYVAVTRGDSEYVHGWAIPAATDIAFALAVLAVIGTHLPSALRAFLLTLAVVDDLIAIAIIAIAYTEKVDFLFLGAAVVPIALFGFLTHRGITSFWLLTPLALISWVLVHESGIHATIAGVALGLSVPVVVSGKRDISVAHRFEHLTRPVSAGVAVPIFAFFSAGVQVVGGGFGEAMNDPVVWGVVAGLVVGKVIGVLLGTWLAVKLIRSSLDDSLDWADIFGVSLLAGIGFTVSLLVNELAFGTGSDHTEHGRVGVLLGSLIAALLASIVLIARNRKYRTIYENETRDDDNDGVPDAFEEADEERARVAAATKAAEVGGNPPGSDGKAHAGTTGDEAQTIKAVDAEPKAATAPHQNPNATDTERRR